MEVSDMIMGRQQDSSKKEKEKKAEILELVFLTV